MARLTEPGPRRLGRHAVSVVAAAIVDRLNGDHRPQRLDRDAEPLSEGEVVLDQSVLGADAATDHAVAALDTAGAIWAGAAEVRVRHLLAGLAEEDTDGGLAEGVADSEIVGRLAHDLLDGAFARVRDHAQHPGRRHVVRRELSLPIGDVRPLRVLEERGRRDIESVGVVEAAAANACTRKDHHVWQTVDPLHTKAFQPRSPQITTQIPRRLGEVLVGEPAAGLDDMDAVALLGQPQCRD